MIFVKVNVLLKLKLCLFDVANVFSVCMCMCVCVFLCVVSIFILLYRMVPTCQPQNVILRQGMSHVVVVSCVFVQGEAAESSDS